MNVSRLALFLAEHRAHAKTGDPVYRPACRPLKHIKPKPNRRKEPKAAACQPSICTYSPVDTRVSRRVFSPCSNTGLRPGGQWPSIARQASPGDGALASNALRIAVEIPYRARRHQRGNRHAEPHLGNRRPEGVQPLPARDRAQSEVKRPRPSWRRPESPCDEGPTSWLQRRGGSGCDKVRIEPQAHLQPVTPIFCSWCAAGLCTIRRKGGASGAKYSRRVRPSNVTTP